MNDQPGKNDQPGMNDMPSDGVNHDASGDFGRVIDSARVDANWRAINIELDAPRPALVERLLRRVGFPSRITRVIAATPALRRAWYLAVGATMFLGLAATDASAPRQSVLVLLTLAPLIPVFGVALAYGPLVDPAYEAELATPMRGLRLVAIRAAVVLLVSAVLVTAIAMLNEVARPFAAAWLLPAFAVTCASLMMMTFMAPRRAVIAVSIGWFTVVFIVESVGAPLATFSVVGPVTAGVVACVATSVVAVRRASFDRLVHAI
jgi:hypothetical protein